MTRMRCCRVALALIPVLAFLSSVQVRAAETTPPPLSTVETAPPPVGVDPPVYAAPPAAPVAQPGTPVAGPVPSGSALALDPAPITPAASPAPPPGVVLQQRVSPEPAPFYERWSFWAGVGVVAAVVIAVITVSADHGPSAPSTDLGDHRAF